MICGTMGAVNPECSIKPSVYEFLNALADAPIVGPHLQAITFHCDLARNFCPVAGLAILGVGAV